MQQPLTRLERRKATDIKKLHSKQGHQQKTLKRNGEQKQTLLEGIKTKRKR